MINVLEGIKLWENSAGDTIRRTSTRRNGRSVIIVDNLSLRSRLVDGHQSDASFDQDFSVYRDWKEAARITQTSFEEARSIFLRGGVLSYVRTRKLPTIGIVELGTDSTVRTGWVIKGRFPNCQNIWLRWHAQQIQTGKISE